MSKDLMPFEGRLSVRIKKKGEVVEEKDLGKNLVVNNAKFVMTYMLGQQPTTVVSEKIKGFDPRNSDPTNGGLDGGAPITTFNDSVANLRPLFMAFGTNTINTQQGPVHGPAPSLEHKGLFYPINKLGHGPLISNSVQSYFYGGQNDTIIQYLTNNDGVPNAWIRFIVTMRTNEGQPPGLNTMTYREAGLFTGMCVRLTDNQGTVMCPIMIARKTFPDITKTPELELQWIWEIRF